jgi:hypothetical protein
MSEHKRSNPRYHAPKPTAWLWKVAGAIVVAAGAIIFVISRDMANPMSMYLIRRVIALTLIAVGVCAIAATAGRWTSR